MKPFIDINLKDLESDICDIKFELSQVRYSRDFESKVHIYSKKINDVSKTLFSIICLQEHMANQRERKINFS